MIEAPNMYPEARRLIDALPLKAMPMPGEPGEVNEDLLADAIANALVRAWYEGQKAGLSQCINSLGILRKTVLDRLG